MWCFWKKSDPEIGEKLIHFAGFCYVYYVVESVSTVHM